MAEVSTALAAASLFCWIGLVFFRGRFWRADQRLSDADRHAGAPWPGVVAVVPARNEAATIGRTVAALLGQGYQGAFGLIVVDDGSDDGTAAAARAAAASGPPLEVTAAGSLAPGWTGKLWAVSRGLDRAAARYPRYEYVLLTDADITLAPGVLARLVAAAEGEALDLVSVMAHLHCAGAWERLLIPAFVFFFQKLYPFRRVNDPARKTAAAAGGCMLVRRSALERAGGIEAIRGRIIDDCALAGLIKREGAIWLGFDDGVVSVRPYRRLAEIWAMVARTAFTQLGHSAAALAATVAGMAVIYLGPPAALVLGVAAGSPLAAAGGLAAWGLMALAYRPTLRLYGEPAAMALLLPAAAALFTLMTLDSARRHWRGRGGAWKGRTYGPTAPGGG